MKIDKQSKCMLEGIEREHDKLNVAFEMFLAGVEEADIPVERYEHIEEIYNIIKSLEFPGQHEAFENDFEGEMVKGNLGIRVGYLICRLNEKLKQELDKEAIPSALEKMLREYIKFTEEIIFFIDFTV